MFSKKSSGYDQPPGLVHHGEIDYSATFLLLFHLHCSAAVVPSTRYIISNEQLFLCDGDPGCIFFFGKGAVSTAAQQ